jgi:uncharacterized protein (DUF1697 family)
MTGYVALLRAVNVGGRKLLMDDLRDIAAALGFANPRTFIASGNLLFGSDLSETRVKSMLEKSIAEHMAAAVPVMLRTAAELERVAKANPFSGEPGNRVAAIFLDRSPPSDTIERARNLDDERIAIGEREVYVAYGEQGMGRSRLRIPAVEAGTARNMNTVAKLAGLAKEIA